MATVASATRPLNRRRQFSSLSAFSSSRSSPLFFSVSFPAASSSSLQAQSSCLMPSRWLVVWSMAIAVQSIQTIVVPFFVFVVLFFNSVPENSLFPFPSSLFLFCFAFPSIRSLLVVFVLRSDFRLCCALLPPCCLFCFAIDFSFPFPSLLFVLFAVSYFQSIRCSLLAVLFVSFARSDFRNFVPFSLFVLCCSRFSEYSFFPSPSWLSVIFREFALPFSLIVSLCCFAAAAFAAAAAKPLHLADHRHSMCRRLTNSQADTMNALETETN